MVFLPWIWLFYVPPRQRHSVISGLNSEWGGVLLIIALSSWPLFIRYKSYNVWGFGFLKTHNCYSMSIFRSLNVHCLLNNYLITAAPVREINIYGMRSCSRQPLLGARLAATLTSHVGRVKPVFRWSWPCHMRVQGVAWVALRTALPLLVVRAAG